MAETATGADMRSAGTVGEEMTGMTTVVVTTIVILVVTPGGTPTVGETRGGARGEATAVEIHAVRLQNALARTPQSVVAVRTLTTEQIACPCRVRA